MHCKKWKQNQNNAATMHLELRCRLFWVFCFNYFAHISGLNLIPSHLQDLACFFLPIPILASRSSVLSWCTCLSDGLSQLMRQHSWSAPSSLILFAKQRFCGCYADFKTYIIFFAFSPILNIMLSMIEINHTFHAKMSVCFWISKCSLRSHVLVGVIKCAFWVSKYMMSKNT